MICPQLAGVSPWRCRWRPVVACTLPFGVRRRFAALPPARWWPLPRAGDSRPPRARVLLEFQHPLAVLLDPGRVRAIALLRQRRDRRPDVPRVMQPGVHVELAEGLVRLEFRRRREIVK